MGISYRSMAIPYRKIINMRDCIVITLICNFIFPLCFAGSRFEYKSLHEDCKSFNWVKNDTTNKFGCKDDDGNLIIDYKYDNYFGPFNKDCTIWVKKDHKFFLINSSDSVLSSGYDCLYLRLENYSKVLHIVGRKNIFGVRSYGVIDSHDSIIVPIKYRYHVEFFPLEEYERLEWIGFYKNRLCLDYYNEDGNLVCSVLKNSTKLKDLKGRTYAKYNKSGLYYKGNLESFVKVCDKPSKKLELFTNRNFKKETHNDYMIVAVYVDECDYVMDCKIVKKSVMYDINEKQTLDYIRNNYKCNSAVLDGKKVKSVDFVKLYMDK